MNAFDRIASLTAAEFEPHLDSRFALHDGDGNSTELTLIEVKRLRGRPNQERQPFSLLFRGSSDVQICQGLYRFDHASVAPFELFLVPVAPDAKGPCYESLLN